MAIAETVPEVMRFLRCQMRAAAAEMGSVPQFRTLVFLRHHPGASLADLAEHLGVTPPTASALVERLVQRGLVHRAADPRERRRVVLGLTPAGARLLERAWRATQARLRQKLASLPPTRLEQLREAMHLLEEVFRRGDS
ncbi:MAG: MarR family transcriptional regulator [Armatimonadota bacterium]|nr:MarR family transcriptional regulator [Armatimonadota bacterium]MDR7439607.1 MarR family transcriptional regulator [Armatimonadota bacterium]MDR7562834.1 MarR family transcriptional regulator [Armatimonadota bacterium]MDR7568927.1 MarR family transcriptional regulator [Armatimonadota bacterium]MDR7602080.1 MarR family transcriptional regulator [Armatimonadota bacterium]